MITRPKQIHLILFGILLLAVGLRVSGIRFGLPNEYHPDEEQYVRQAAKMGEIGLKPTWWNNPPFYKYVYLAEYGTLYAVGRLAGWYESAADFGQQNTTDPSNLYLLGRATTAIIGSITVLLVYWLGKTSYNRNIGLISAAFLAVSFIHVRDSHYAVNDVPTTFLVTLGMLASVKIVKTSERKWYVIGGIALGLGFATKYSALVVIVPLLMAHLLSPDVSIRKPSPSFEIRRLVVLFATAIVAAIIASPYFLLAPREVVTDIYEFLVADSQRGFFGWEIDSDGGYAYYLKALVWGLGFGLLGLVIIGMLLSAIRHKPVDLVLLVLPLLMFLYLGRQEMYFARLVLPAIPVLLVLAAVSLDWIVSRITRNNTAYILGIVLGVFLVVAQPLVYSIRHNSLLFETDSRTLAKDWIESNIPAGSKIALDWERLSPQLSTADQTLAGSASTYDAVIIKDSEIAGHSLEWYRDEGFDYLVLNSYISSTPRLDPKQNAQREAFYARLQEEAELVYENTPFIDGTTPHFVFDEVYGPAVTLWQRERPGPAIKIYSITQS